MIQKPWALLGMFGCALASAVTPTATPNGAPTPTTNAPANVVKTAPPPPCAPSSEGVPVQYEIGLALQALHPNHLPGDPANMPVYGPRIGMPLFGNTLYAQGMYGSADPVGSGATTIVLAEVGYQIPLELPFFHTFIEGGAHYLHYSKPGMLHDMFGGNVGFGLILPMGREFKLQLALKTYLQERAIISMGGGFSIFL